MKEKMYEFIKLKTPELKEVLDVQIKDCDDEDGVIGEHYIVNCVLNMANISTSNEVGDIVKTCLVDKQEFKKWLKKKNSIKWI